MHILMLPCLLSLSTPKAKLHDLKLSEEPKLELIQYLQEISTASKQLWIFIITRSVWNKYHIL